MVEQREFRGVVKWTVRGVDSHGIPQSFTLLDEKTARMLSAAHDLLDVSEKMRTALAQAGYGPQLNSDNPLEHLLALLNLAVGKARGVVVAQDAQA